MWFGKACSTKLHYQIWGFQEQIKHTTTSLAKTQLHPRNRSQEKITTSLILFGCHHKPSIWEAHKLVTAHSIYTSNKVLH